MRIDLKDLPPLSPLVPALLDLDLDADDAERTLIRVVETEPVLGARLVAAANSAAYAAPGVRYATVVTAVRRIGLRRASQLALAVLLGKPLDRTLRRGLSRALWLHALALALAAQDLARLRQHPTPNAAYLLGLLHDLGYMAMEYLRPGTLWEVVDQTANAGLDMAGAEARVFGLQHQEVTMQLLETWKMPAELIEPIAIHHRPGNAPESLAAILVGAETIARCEDVAAPLYDGLDHPFRPLAMDRAWPELGLDEHLGMDDEAIDALTGGIVTRVDQLREAAAALVMAA
jgi:HD-like signal output (HDOD) protein